MEIPTMAHSPLGGSVASRFIACPGSVNLITSIPEVLEADPLREEYREAGTAAHAMGARALWSDQDAWELAEQDFGYPLGPEDIVAVQVYLDYIRSVRSFNQFIEEPVEAKRLNKHLHGTLDWAQVHESENWMEIVDYKHGAGVVVEVEDNPQLKYYAFCKLMQWTPRRSMLVRLTIVQPRAGGIRNWETTAGDILDWGRNVLLPAMEATETSHELNPGKQCQFCPAKLYCRAALSWFDEASENTAVLDISDEMLAKRFDRLQVVMFVKKAIEQEALKRSLAGHKLPGTKLVMQKANRVMKSGAEHVFKPFPDAWTEPELKSPAQLERIAAIKHMVQEWAYTPQTGYAIAREDDRRHGVQPPTAAGAFGQYIESDDADT
jgi:hypothetical protein